LKKNLKSIILILIFSIIIAINFIDSKTDYKPTDSEKEVIEYFKEIALESEFGKSPLKTLKWIKPMVLYISTDSIYKKQIKNINETIQKINKLTSDDFRIELTNDSLKSNAIIYLCKKKNLPKLDLEFSKLINQNAVGYVNINWRGYKINKARIFVSTSENFEIQKCTILQEITQSLGLINDSKKYANSIFYQYQVAEKILTYEYSEIDIELIKYLYNSKMTFGLNSEESEEIIKRIMKAKKL
jgi:hypothetical protein